MGLYYFDVEDGASYPDPAGTDLPDLEAVRIEALKRSVTLLAEHKSKFWQGEYWKMTVSDRTRQILFTLNFMAVNAPSTQEYGLKLSEPSPFSPPALT